MKFHAPSFLLGAGLAAATFAARARLRPVVVEISALGLHLGRVGLGLWEREREGLEDLWAEIEERVRERASTTRSRREVAQVEERPGARTNGSSSAPR